MILTWAGKEPGEVSDIFKNPDPGNIQVFIDHAKKMITDFNKKYLGEKTVQLGLGPDVSYQVMISVMDGIRETMPDVVLISSEEAEARAKGTSIENKAEEKTQ